MNRMTKKRVGMVLAFSLTLSRVRQPISGYSREIQIKQRRPDRSQPVFPHL